MRAGRWTGLAISLLWAAMAPTIENKECLECHSGVLGLDVGERRDGIHRAHGGLS